MEQGHIRQAGCVEIDGRAVLIEGPPGIGKTSLALMLIDRGARLIGDDGVTLSVREGILWAAPPPNTAGMVEIRNIGFVSLATTQAPVALLIQVQDNAPRFLEIAGKTQISGIAVPSIAFDARGEAAAIRAEYALRLHGLPFP